MATAVCLKPLISPCQKAILACWMGGNAVKEVETVLNEAGVPTFTYPDAAARAFCLMAQYSSNLRMLYETPMLRVAAPKEIHRYLTSQNNHSGFAVPGVLEGDAKLAAIKSYIVDRLEAGALRPQIAKTFPFDKIAMRIDTSNPMEQFGKVVVTI
jgi:NADPH:quinone reductase-like Zn-dependent oxidoreductase